VFKQCITYSNFNMFNIFFLSKMLIAGSLVGSVIGATGCKQKKAEPAAITTSTEKPQTISVSSELSKKFELDKIKLPAGFSISVYAEVENARSMCLSPNGTLFVGNRDKENVYAVVDVNKDGVADKVYKVATGLNTPNGVAFKDGSLYVATISTIYRIDNIEANLANPPKPAVVYDKYPTDKSHGWKFIAFGPDGKLYVPVGAPCNTCESENPVYASITTINADGTGMEVYAKGIRNSVGFTWHPVTKQLWFTDNGRDMLGDDLPEDELNIAPQKGMHFGYPYCHQGNTMDPEFGKGKNCSDYTPPVDKLGPHTASLGLRFYTGSQFPPQYKNAIFIAQHGSWNRSTPLGYRLMVATMDANGKPAKAIPFAEGWLQADNKVIGRPVDVQLLPDGSMLVSDDYKGAIYRISYKG
jgi:glucose/arabinose dehydrogenase